MLLGVTTLGGDEPLGGWNIPERPELLFPVRYFDLNTVVIDEVCALSLRGALSGSGPICRGIRADVEAEIQDPISTSIRCLELSTSLVSDCFTSASEIGTPSGQAGVSVPAAYCLTAESGSYGVGTVAVELDKSGFARGQFAVYGQDVTLTYSGA